MADIERYEFEIMHIINELENLENGNFYENGERRGTPCVRNVCKDIRTSFIELMVKIAEEKESTGEMLNRLLNKKENK